MFCVGAYMSVGVGGQIFKKDLLSICLWRSGSSASDFWHTAATSNKQPRPPLYPLFPKITVYLQDENEEVDGFAPLVDVVMGRALVAFVKLDLLDHIGVAQDSQQHLVWDLRRAEQAHLCKEREGGYYVKSALLLGHWLRP